MMEIKLSEPRKKKRDAFYREKTRRKAEIRKRKRRAREKHLDVEGRRWKSYK